MSERLCSELQVTAALIPLRRRLFIAQRPPQKKFGLCWEFPGGKVQPGESLEECLYREIKEELNWEVQVRDIFQHVEHLQAGFRMDLFAFWCRFQGGELRLREHVAYSWVRLEDLRHFPFTAPDRQLITRLEKLPHFPY